MQVKPLMQQARHKAMKQVIIHTFKNELVILGLGSIHLPTILVLLTGFHTKVSPLSQSFDMNLRDISVRSMCKS
jgi:hypothetical protein